MEKVKARAEPWGEWGDLRWRGGLGPPLNGCGLALSLAPRNFDFGFECDDEVAYAGLVDGFDEA